MLMLNMTKSVMMSIPALRVTFCLFLLPSKMLMRHIMKFHKYKRKNLLKMKKTTTKIKKILKLMDKILKMMDQTIQMDLLMM